MTFVYKFNDSRCSEMHVSMEEGIYLSIPLNEGNALKSQYANNTFETIVI